MYDISQYQNPKTGKKRRFFVGSREKFKNQFGKMSNVLF
jgi:hypothetical protein